MYFQRKLRPICQELGNLSSLEEEPSSSQSMSSPSHSGTYPDRRRFKRTKLPPLPKRMKDSLEPCIISDLRTTISNITAINLRQSQTRDTHCCITAIHQTRDNLQDRDYVRQKFELMKANAPSETVFNDELQKIDKFINTRLDFIDFFSQTKNFRHLVTGLQVEGGTPEEKRSL